MNAMLLNICALFLYRMVKNKNSPCTPQKKEVDEVIPTLNSGEILPIPTLSIPLKVQRSLIMTRMLMRKNSFLEKNRKQKTVMR